MYIDFFVNQFLLIFLPDLQLSFFNNIFFSCNDSNEIIDELLFCHELEKGIIAEYIKFLLKILFLNSWN